MFKVDAVPRSFPNLLSIRGEEKKFSPPPPPLLLRIFTTYCVILSKPLIFPMPLLPYLQISDNSNYLIRLSIEFILSVKGNNAYKVLRTVPVT